MNSMSAFLQSLQHLRSGQYNNNVLHTWLTAQLLLSEECTKDGTTLSNYNLALSHARQAQERIQEFARLQRARHLLDAISLTNELLSNGSDVEILSLAGTIIKRLKVLCATNTPLTNSDNSKEDTKPSESRLTHSGIYHCCTFCSSGGKKETVCGCKATMPGGYQGCGHGHIGHPGGNHWSCCGSILRHGPCLTQQKSMYQLLL